MDKAEVDDRRLGEELWAQLRVVDTCTQVDTEVVVVFDFLIFNLNDVSATLLDNLLRNDWI